MYKVKRFSKIDDFEDFVLSYLPKKFIINRNGVEVSDDENIFSELSSTEKNNIKLILQGYDKLSILAIKKYEEDDDSLRLINPSGLYVFDIQLDRYANGKIVISLATSFKSFEDYMGWYDVTIEVSTKKVINVSYGD